jgi:hypothetical protein
VENPVEKIDENRISVGLSEEFSGLHHHGAIRPTDYTLLNA